MVHLADDQRAAGKDHNLRSEELARGGGCAEPQGTQKIQDQCAVPVAVVSLNRESRDSGGGSHNLKRAG